MSTRGMVRLLALVLALLTVAALYFGLRYWTASRAPAWRAELIRLIRDRPPGARVYISVGTGRPVRWHEVRSLEEDQLTLDGAEPVPLTATSAFVVTYGNGEILATSTPTPTERPRGAYFARSNRAGVGETLSAAEVAAEIAQTSSCVSIAFGSVRDSGARGKVYETKVSNRCAYPVRVTHFGAYSLQGGVWKLNTIVEGFFTAEQFREWYAVSSDGWLAPGASGTDRENYGASALWVYFFEMPGGKRGKAMGRAPI